MESAAKLPKTLIRSVLDAFRGTPNDGPDLEVDVEDLERDLDMLREDTSDDEASHAAAATEMNGLQASTA